MSGEFGKPVCPHCGTPLQPFSLPDGSGYDEPFHLACFSDECDYFRRGWTWMFDHYGVKASYRYRVNPATGVASPLPVWSKNAIKDCILDAVATAEHRSPGEEVERRAASVKRTPARPKKQAKAPGKKGKAR